MTITIDGSSGIASVDGSAGSPSVRGSDANSGILYTADAIKFSTGGTQRAVIDNNGLSSAGHILQVVQATSTSGVNSTTSTYATAGLEAAITPTSSSNKVLIKMVSPMTGFAGGTEHNRGSLKVYRGGSSGTSVSGILSTQYSEDDFYSDAVITFLDSPSTTSATTYTVMMARVNGSGEYSFNRDGAQTATLVLMEVAG